MQLNPIIDIIPKLSKLAIRNSPTIFTALSVGGVVTSIGLSIDATLKAAQLITKERELRLRDAFVEGYLEPVPLTKKDIAQLIWKEYLPVIGVGIGTIICIVSVNKIHMRRNAALVGLYELADTTLREYRAKVVETIGAKKELDIRDSVHQDHLDKHPVEQTNIIVTNCGDTLCYDSISGRYFRSDVAKILKAQNDFNYRLLKDMTRPLNEFYDEIGLDPTSIGYDVGWSWEWGQLEIRFSSRLSKDNNPCLVLEFRNGPRAI